MSSLEISLLVIDLLLWIVLVLTKAVRQSHSSLSRFELERRDGNGDQEAHHELWREMQLPRISGIISIVATTLTVLVAVLTFVVVGPYLGVFFGLVLIVSAELLQARPKVQRTSSKLYNQKEVALLRFVEHKSWLDRFAVATEQQEVRINSRNELARLLKATSGDVLTNDERRMLLSELDFSTKTVADVMTPRTMIDSIDVTEAIGPLVLDTLHRTGHSRFPVFEDDIDHVVGMLYLHDLVGLKTAHETVKEALDPNVFYVGEHRSLEHALHAFLRTHHHLFIVVNEYRETVGLLSLEDVVEALIGRSIVDEFDEFDDLRSVAASNPKANNAPKGKKDV